MSRSYAVAADDHMVTLREPRHKAATTQAEARACRGARLLQWPFDGQVAQSVERSPEKAGVGGSIPSLATIFNNLQNVLGASDIGFQSREQ